MATKKKPETNNFQRTLPDLPFDEDSLIEAGEERLNAKKPSTPDYAAQLAELSQKLQALETSNETLQRTNLALMGSGNVQQTPPVFGPTAVDLENLPDPVTDAKAYAAELLKRSDAVLQTRQRAEQWQQEQRSAMQSRIDNVWEQFSQAYPQYAGNTDLVEAASTKAVAQAKQSGIDPTKYMFGATPQFFADTVKILNNWGIKGEAEAAGDETEPKPALRTGGIPGGNESGGKLTNTSDPDDLRMPSLAEEVRDWKLKGGWF